MWIVGGGFRGCELYVNIILSSIAPYSVAWSTSWSSIFHGDMTLGLRTCGMTLAKSMPSPREANIRATTIETITMNPLNALAKMDH